MYEENKQTLIKFFFEFKNNLYLYHLSTYKYPRHVAVAALLDKFDTLIDNFLEIYFGKYGRPDVFPEVMLRLKKLSDSDALFELDSYIEFLTHNIPILINPDDSDLFNIRDEMKGLLNNNKYLFLLN